MGRIEFGNFKMSWGKSSVSDTYDLKGTSAREKVYGYADNFTEEAVTAQRAMGLAACFISMNVRARTIASIPCKPMISENGKTRILEDSPIYYPLVQQANQYMSSANMFLTSMLHSDGWGNSIIGINRDSRFRPASFEIIEPNEWSVEKINGDAYYRIRGEVYLSRDVLHYRWFSLDGLCGISSIIQNKMTFGKAFKENRYAATTIGNQVPGFLHYEGQLNDIQRALNQKSWEQDRMAGRVPILTGRWDHKSTIMSPEAAEYIERANLTDEQIYGIFQLPPVFAQNYRRATWANAEQSDLFYAKHTVTPICRVIEQENNLKLYTEKEKKTQFTKFNLNGLMRGDSAARAQFYTAMRNVGGLNGNDIREFEDMNSYEGGDIFTTQVQNIPLDMLREYYDKTMEPEASQQMNSKEIKKNGYHYIN